MRVHLLGIALVGILAIALWPGPVSAQGSVSPAYKADVLKLSRWIDTYLDSPNDIVPWQDSVPISGSTYRVGPRSVVILWSSKPS